ncbi:hypothetical protein OBBRIDRAFT_739567, partial [Obba rivulosa]
LNKEDVLDDTYRKARKLDSKDFAVKLDIDGLGLPKLIGDHLLEEMRPRRAIRCEMYKLNVYGSGSFFKSHVDTPRSETLRLRPF